MASPARPAVSDRRRRFDRLLADGAMIALGLAVIGGFLLDHKNFNDGWRAPVAFAASVIGVPLLVHRFAAEWRRQGPIDEDTRRDGTEPVLSTTRGRIVAGGSAALLLGMALMLAGTIVGAWLVVPGLLALLVGSRML